MFRPFNSLILKYEHRPLIRRGGCSFEAPKEPKVLSAERLLCRTGLSPANRSELTGWENLPLAAPLLPRASANIPYSLPVAPPTTFCPPSPEASLLPLGRIELKILLSKLGGPYNSNITPRVGSTLPPLLSNSLERKREGSPWASCKLPALSRSGIR